MGAHVKQLVISLSELERKLNICPDKIWFPAGEELVLFDRYVRDFYVGIVQ